MSVQKFVLNSLIILMMIFTACSPESRMAGHLLQAKPIDSLSVATIFKDLAVELQSVKTRLESDTTIKVTITEADLVLDNITTDVATGTLSLLIFDPAYNYTRVNERTVTFSLLSVDRPKLPREGHPDDRAQYYRYTLRKTDSLSTLLYNTAKTLSQIPLVLDADPAKATQKSGEIDIKFSIEQNYALELKPTILSVGVDVKGSYDDANAQTLKVLFTVKNK